MQNDSTERSSAIQQAERRRLSWRKKLCFGLLATIVVYGSLEIVLWLVGVRTIEDVRDPFVGFRPGVPLFVKNDDKFVTNPLRTANFNVQQFPQNKSPNTLRIFCLGGSTTYGHPYDARLAYPNALKLRLECLAPGTKFEVINCGGVSYASYRLALLVDELVKYEPDVFVIHTGHNEFLETRTYHKIRERPMWVNQLIVAGTKLRSVALLSRFVEAGQQPVERSVLSSDVRTELEQTNGPQTYHRDDAQHQHVVQHLEFSLRRMAETARKAGAQVIFVKPASDLRGMSPFKSESSITDLADIQRQSRLLQQAQVTEPGGAAKSRLEILREAVAVDPRYADGQWLLGCALFESGQMSDARAAFIRARDEDVCPLRATSTIEELIVKVAGDVHSPVIDLGRRLEEICQAEFGHTIVGPESFLDHVHLTPERHADLAKLLCQELDSMGIVKSVELTEQQEREWHSKLDAGVTARERGLALHTLSMTLGWTGKNREALRLSQQAIELVPSEGRVHAQLGRLQEKLGDKQTALKTYATAVELDGINPLVLFRYGSLLLDFGRRDEARLMLQRAARNTPANAPESFQESLQKRIRECQ